MFLSEYGISDLVDSMIENHRPKSVNVHIKHENILYMYIYNNNTNNNDDNKK